MTGRVRVLVYLTAPDGDVSVIEEAYHAISGRLQGTPGLVGNELLRSLSDPDSFAVISEWESLDAFRAWEQGPDHRDVTAPLRPFQSVTMRPAVYEVTAAYGG
ncbi:antibiotic biosynthesis monooxygenase [Carbonactinospora thermoautotrophica]|uniref:Antibiotic biosynthesis monooxygenase n=1 Tax=Carbonactinospora thermoautotrophica TaxID=1469144 RepID=A0A132N3E4_9ACTN|nr:antibiotic biosynthesis monooxygenase [Carbonactinospora thermoautotrophica]KWX04668.1 antibiotic biosynthesis monooxygenase [Carbonactinospora thermoautotrophica]KWX08152.1 antibiotic biosynthesis monooxygenase [Carbonactinospora thermoautotrophica]